MDVGRILGVPYANSLERPIFGKIKSARVSSIERVSDLIMPNMTVPSRCGKRESRRVFARDVWVALEYTTPVHGAQMSFHEWLSWMFDTYTKIKHAEISTTLRALWFARNRLVHEASSNSIARWYPPPWDFVKVNVDTGFQLGQKKASSGVVIRDENGQILGAYSRTTYLVLFVFAAEAIAVTHGLRFAYELGFFTTHAMAKDGLSCDEDRFWVEEASTVVVAAAAEDRRLSDPP
ncbi:hypothetical protein GOBAR_AA38098 [Gossypium barbadense]|uniref:RNase H type-1 domain-containing protein n=1 Tax=Gossypium barbadense TaxID=3634 RepID=A0A2P5VUV1_GOSBA|nr:hypothetical protein GOBAR_AA38098 [Gossypium barbadense]